MKIEDLKIVMSDLIRQPKISDEKYKYAYIDGVLDFFNKISAIIQQEITNDKRRVD